MRHFECNLGRPYRVTAGRGRAAPAQSLVAIALRIAAISAAASSWSIVTDAGGVEAHRQHDPPAKPAADQRGQPGQKPADGNPRSAQNPDAGPYRDAAISRSSARAPARIPSMP